MHTPKTCDDCTLTWDRKHNVKDIVLCPLHAAAPKLLEALGVTKAALLLLATRDGNDPYWNKGGEGYVAFSLASEVIAEAKGE